MIFSESQNNNGGPKASIVTAFVRYGFLGAVVAGRGREAEGADGGGAATPELAL